MIQHILTLIWNQRKSNVWIFLELLVVVCILLVIMDSFLVDIYTYKRPLGFDITNVYQVNFAKDNTQTGDTVDYRSEGESLLQVVNNLRQCPEVENISICSSAIPYTWIASWSPLKAASDTSSSKSYYQVYDVMPDFFKVFNMHAEDGSSLYEQVLQNPGQYVLSYDLAKKLFPTSSAIGQEVKHVDNPEWAMQDRVSAVTTPLRKTDFDRSEPVYYQLLRTDKDLLDDLQEYKISPLAMQCVMRMRPGFQAEDMEAFLQRQSERLQVKSIYVSTVTPVSDYRADRLKSRFDNHSKKIALVSFMMANIFFGIVGTFWLRTQSRRAEIGLRAAVGASKSRLRGQLYGEGLLLLLLTLPIAIIYMANMLYLDMPDTDRLAYTGWRFFTTFGATYLVLGLMIYLGISIPAGKITRMNPADTLHYE